MIEQRAAAFVVTDHTDRENARAQRRKIVDGVRRAARVDFGVAVAQNQHRRFAGDARNFAGNEFVEHEIADDADRLA